MSALASTSSAVNGVKKDESDDEAYDELFFDGDSSSDGDTVGRPSQARPSAHFRIGRTLAQPSTPQYSCQSLLKMVEEGDIDLEADYQREVVWSKEKQSALIDSIMRHFYVPPILFASQMRTNEDGEMQEILTCVDGKQRLTAICRFLKGLIPVKDPETGRSYYFKRAIAQSHRPDRYLSEAQKKSFEMKQMQTVKYVGLSEADERDMFQRVQKGMTLTPAEKLAANLGPWPDFINEMRKRFVEPDTGSLSLLVTLRRGRDFMFIAQICVLLINELDESFDPTSAKVQAFFNQVGSARGPTDMERKIILETMARFIEIAYDDNANQHLLPQKIQGKMDKQMAPVEVIFAALIVRMFKKASNREIADIIAGLMNLLREKHTGNVFLNTKVERTTRIYIHHQERLHPNWLADDLGVLTGQTLATRRRRRETSEEDPDYVPPMSDLYNVQRRRLG